MMTKKDIARELKIDTKLCGAIKDKSAYYFVSAIPVLMSRHLYDKSMVGFWHHDINNWFVKHGNKKIDVPHSQFTKHPQDSKTFMICSDAGYVKEIVTRHNSPQAMHITVLHKIDNIEKESLVISVDPLSKKSSKTSFNFPKNTILRMIEHEYMSDWRITIREDGEKPYTLLSPEQVIESSKPFSILFEALKKDMLPFSFIPEKMSHKPKIVNGINTKPLQELAFPISDLGDVGYLHTKLHNFYTDVKNIVSGTVVAKFIKEKL